MKFIAVILEDGRKMNIFLNHIVGCAESTANKEHTDVETFAETFTVKHSLHTVMNKVKQASEKQ